VYDMLFGISISVIIKLSLITRLNKKHLGEKRVTEESYAYAPNKF